MASSATLKQQLQSLINATEALVSVVGPDERALLRQALNNLNVCVEVAERYAGRAGPDSYLYLEVDAQIRWVQEYERSFHTSNDETLLKFAREVLEGAILLAKILQPVARKTWVHVPVSKKRRAAEFDVGSAEEAGNNTDASCADEESEEEADVGALQYNEAYF